MSLDVCSGNLGIARVSLRRSIEQAFQHIKDIGTESQQDSLLRIAK